MTLKISKLFLPLLLCLCLLPSLAFAADSAGDSYDDGDVTIVKQIIGQSPTLTAEYGPNSEKSTPDKWDFVVFENEDNEDPDSSLRATCIRFGGIVDQITIEDYKGALDVSGLTCLIELWCFDNPEITSIKVPASMEYLDCQNTGIESLDVSRCTNLHTLYCSETSIQNLDVSANSLLNDLIANPSKTLKTSTGTLTFIQTDVSEIRIDDFDATDNNTIVLSATWIDPDYDFVRWISVPDSAVLENNVATFVVNGDATISAEFIKSSNGGGYPGVSPEDDANASGDSDSDNVAADNADSGTPKTSDANTAFATSAIALLMCAVTACTFAYRRMKTDSN